LCLYIADMKINVPDEEEYQQDQKKRRIQAILGGLFGVFFFSLVGFRIFWYGFDEVAIYTWLALGFGVISFGFLAYKFGDEFWSALFRN